MTQRSTRREALARCLALGAWAWWCAPAGASAGDTGLLDLEGRAFDPFARRAGTQVFVFTSVDCPISNRYAPTFRRLVQQFAPKGVTFWLVYPNPHESAADVHRHLDAYGYTVGALRDPRHAFVKRTGATVTPEAIVFTSATTIVYRGRIDDRFVAFGVERPAPTQHDLAAALADVLGGKPVAHASVPAIGCYIADFLP